MLKNKKNYKSCYKSCHKMKLIGSGPPPPSKAPHASILQFKTARRSLLYSGGLTRSKTWMQDVFSFTYLTLCGPPPFNGPHAFIPQFKTARRSLLYSGGLTQSKTWMQDVFLFTYLTLCGPPFQRPPTHSSHNLKLQDVHFCYKWV